jgi:hypothetical protein
MSYSFFLFTKLHDVILGDSGEPYDIQFDDMVDMYTTYKYSEHNTPSVGEYECMVEHLQQIKSDRSKAKFERLMVKSSK